MHHKWLLCAALFCASCAQQGTASKDAGDAPCEDAGGKPGANCPCDPTSYVTTDCYTGPLGTSGHGPCRAGKRSCDATTGTLTACVGEVVPQTETCNLLDDDCNGVVDDVPEIADAGNIAYCNSPACDGPYADAGIQCYGADPGICGAGRFACGTNAKVTCQSFGLSAASEVCNGLDDDCNGIIDDGIDTSSLGTCTAPNAVGQCAVSQYVCNNGKMDCPPTSPSTESCDGIDNDCNGTVDDHACAGQTSAIYCCQKGSAYECTATPNDGNHTNCHAAL